MDNNLDTINRIILTNNEEQMLELLNLGLDPNYKNGWALRLAARHGSCGVVKILIQFGANPHLLSETGASPLQLAVYSGLHWETDKWSFLLSCYDSSQLADGAAIAIIFKNLAALTKILQTGRCNTHIPTTLTGKTVEQLAKGYKIYHLISSTIHNADDNNENSTPSSPYHLSRHLLNVNTYTSPIASSSSNNTLSPSVARFFHQTTNQPGLTPPRLARGFCYEPSSLT